MQFSKYKYARRMLSKMPLFEKYRDHTMIRRTRYVENLVLMSLALDDPALDGLGVVECGTWKGGMSAGMIEVGGPERDYFFFDSFEGLPPAKEIDGQSAIKWQSQSESPAYYDNCSASLDDFWTAVKRTGAPTERIHAIKGFFEDTVKKHKSPQLAVLRLDGDWYDSTIVCLEAFWEYVAPGGLILIDDYGDWDGCTRAMHDFLSSRKAAEYVQQGPIGRVFFIRRRE